MPEEIVNPMGGVSEQPNFRATKGLITLREAVAVGAICLAGAGAWFALTGDVKAIGTRATTLEDSMRDVTKQVRETHDTTIELRVHQRQTGKQLDRIESMLTGRPAPAREPNP